MEIIKRSNLKDEHKYCTHCGGLVDFKMARTLLCSPPIKIYHCSTCNKQALKVKEE